MRAPHRETKGNKISTFAEGGARRSYLERHGVRAAAASAPAYAAGDPRLAR